MRQHDPFGMSCRKAARTQFQQPIQHLTDKILKMPLLRLVEWTLCAVRQSLHREGHDFALWQRVQSLEPVHQLLGVAQNFGVIVCPEHSQYDLCADPLGIHKYSMTKVSERPAFRQVSEG